MKKEIFTTNLEQFFSVHQLAIMKALGLIADTYNSKCYLVGGIVRDALLGLEGNDLDFVCDDIDSMGDTFLRLVPSATDVTISKTKHEKGETGIIKTNFRTRIINVYNTHIDLVEPRKETYRPESIKPEVERGTIEDDVYRRDFTVNTLYLGLREQEWLHVIDHTKRGLHDLENGILDTPRDPHDTFFDDPTRILRGIRFAACYQMQFSDRIYHLINECIPYLAKVPVEMVHNELIKGAKYKAYFQIMSLLGVLSYYFPEVERLRGLPQSPSHHICDVFGHTLGVVEHLPENSLLRIVGLLHDTGKFIATDLSDPNYPAHGHEKDSEIIAQNLLTKYSFSHAEIEYVCNLVVNHMALHQFSNEMLIKRQKINMCKESSNPTLHKSAEILQKEIERRSRRFYAKYKEIFDQLYILSQTDILSDNPHATIELENLRQTVTAIMQTPVAKDPEKFNLKITGHDIMAVGYKGKEIGDLKSKIQQMVIEGELEPDRKSLLIYLDSVKK